MINIRNKKECCGCEVCAQVCPRKAIKMEPDKKGFLYPNVDKVLCNNCGLCDITCPLRQKRAEREPLHTYALKNKDENIRMSSSSGGIFTLFAEETIKKGGVVYGAVFDKDWNVIHDRIDTIEGITRLRGSKYVQSRMDGIYLKAKKDIQAGMPVLFSGCHCQVAGLLSLLKKKYDNLTTVDVICGGTPSPKIWRDYLDAIITKKERKLRWFTKTSTKNNMTIKSIKFRDKTQSWRKYHTTINVTTESGKNLTISSDLWNHEFITAWLKEYNYRVSCNYCHFRNGRSNSDFTIADYWGIENRHPEISDDKGISMLLCYKTDIPEFVKRQCVYEETPFMDAACGQTSVIFNKDYNNTESAYFFLHNTLGLSLKQTLTLCNHINICHLFFSNFKQKARNLYYRTKHILWQK